MKAIIVTVEVYRATCGYSAKTRRGGRGGVVRSSCEQFVSNYHGTRNSTNFHLCATSNRFTTRYEEGTWYINPPFRRRRERRTDRQVDPRDRIVGRYSTSTRCRASGHRGMEWGTSWGSGGAALGSDDEFATRWKLTRESEVLIPCESGLKSSGHRGK